MLTAEARSTGKVPKAAAKKHPKAKAKGNAKKDDTPPEKRRKSDKEKEEESGVPRTVYATAKKEFMSQEWFLVCRKIFHFIVRCGCSSHLPASFLMA